VVEENLDSRNIKSKFHCNICSEMMGMAFFGNKFGTIISYSAYPGKVYGSKYFQNVQLLER